jgi:dynein heavy chain
MVEEWVNCQKSWMYLENIFGAADIKKALPSESAKFEQVDKFFKTLMNNTNKAANAMRIAKTKPQQLE